MIQRVVEQYPFAFPTEAIRKARVQVVVFLVSSKMDRSL